MVQEAREVDEEEAPGGMAAATAAVVVMVVVMVVVATAAAAAATAAAAVATAAAATTAGSPELWTSGGALFQRAQEPNIPCGESLTSTNRPPKGIEVRDFY